jgi:hypothetical protein
MLSGALFFHRDSLDFYRANPAKPKLKGQFVIYGRKGRWVTVSDGLIHVYERPHPLGKYAIAADVATGRGDDFTNADVIDLQTGQIVAQLHGKIEQSRAADQLHMLGRWYNTAKIAVENQGGYGDGLITFLRDGKRGLPPYPNLYRHTNYARGKKPIEEAYGYPMNERTRQAVLDGLKDWLRQRLFAELPVGTVSELGWFVYADTRPSPRAQEGTNDDRVLSLAVAVDLYRQLGQPIMPRKAWKKRAPRTSPVRSGQ